MGSIVFLIMFVYIIASILSYLIFMIILGITGGMALLGILMINAVILICIYYILKAFGDNNRNET